MKLFIGLDVSLAKTAKCVVSETPTLAEAGLTTCVGPLWPNSPGGVGENSVLALAKS